MVVHTGQMLVGPLLAECKKVTKLSIVLHNRYVIPKDIPGDWITAEKPVQLFNVYVVDAINRGLGVSAKMTDVRTCSEWDFGPQQNGSQVLQLFSNTYDWY